MQPWQFLPFHPSLKQLIESIVTMDFNFTETKVESLYRYHWSVQMDRFLQVEKTPLLAKTDDSKFFFAEPNLHVPGYVEQNDLIRDFKSFSG